jgi:hypothetical protein
MNKSKILGNIVIMLLLGAAISLMWACRRSPATGKAVTKVFEDAGLQMETPVAPEFESTHSNRVLVMFHPFGGGLFTEGNYRVQITVVRISKADLDAKSQIAAGTYEFYEWYTTNHPNLDIRKEGPFWHLRKDIQTPSGEYLYVDGQVQDYGPSETNLAEAKQTIESIKPLR